MNFEPKKESSAAKSTPTIPVYVRKVQKRWRDKNKEALCEKSKNYYNQHKEDEEYMLKRRLYCREYMRRRRLQEKKNKEKL